MLQKIWYEMGRLLVVLFAWMMLKMDIVWKAPRPEGAVILAVNHPSTTDPAVVTTLVPEQASIMILETLFKVPLFGRSLRMSGHIPVVPGNGKAALEEAARLIKAGRTVVIFPEGIISPREGGQHRGHTGVARLALATGAPVIPVGISLDQNCMQYLETKVAGKDEVGAWYFHGPYAMTVGEAHYYSGSADNREEVRAITDLIMDKVSALARESTQRLEARDPVGMSLPVRVFKFGLKFVIAGA